MKVKDAILQMYKTVPFKTDLFTQSIDIDSVVLSSNLATVTTKEYHGLDKDDTCTILGLYFPRDIVSITRVLDKLSIETVSNHDFTENYQKSVFKEQYLKPQEKWG